MGIEEQRKNCDKKTIKKFKIKKKILKKKKKKKKAFLPKS